MKYNFKNIHMGECIRLRAEELEISVLRICSFHKITEEEMHAMYNQESMDTEILLRWCKLLEYDFFRIYTQHLILFAPGNTLQQNLPEKEKPAFPEFRKNVYTRQVVDFILELINTGEKTKLQILEEYKIPKTTLYKWISKYDETK